VRKGLGISFLEIEEAKLAEKNKQVQIIPILDFSAALHFVVAKERSKEPVINAFLQEIRVLWDIAL